MKRRVAVLAALASGVFLALPSAGAADPNNDSGTWDLHIEVPNVSEAPNGDRVAITGTGEFSVHPKSVEAEGEFIHTDSEGTVLITGTWEAVQLISFEFYGCGVVESLGVTLPPNFCGGVLKMRVLLTVETPASLAGAQVEGILTIFCIVGPQAPTSHDELSEEGISLVVPGVLNFNKIVSGMNIYIQTS
jgi:hypothetical protein